MRWLAMPLPVVLLIGCVSEPDLSVDPCTELEANLLPKTMASFAVVRRDEIGLVADFVMEDGRVGRVTCERASRRIDFQIGGRGAT